MPITDPEWLSIRSMAEGVVRRLAGSRTDYFITGKVLKVDVPNKCVYMKEFGSQPIPIVAFDYTVKYYDTTPTGVTVRNAVAQAQMPKVGQLILVAREMGTSRIPRCLGVIQGKNWIVPEVE